MAKVVHDDVIEQILILLDPKDLIPFKSVCKSWRSLITSQRFVNRHLNRSYLEDRYNNERDRRISMVNNFSSSFRLIGSSNGLVCLYHDGRYKFYVGNPLTREVKLLRFLSPLIATPLCWGFGYDSSEDDYKVIFGGMNKAGRLMHLLSMKSNIWRVIGEVKYSFRHKEGILCNGTLHWIASDKNKKILIFSFDLSKEEYEEIPQPDDARFESASRGPRGYWVLGVIKECLCILCGGDVWLMKDYNVKQSWELLPRDLETKYDIVHFMGEVYNFGNTRLYCKTVDRGFRRVDSCLAYPIFVQSLVSPCGNYRVKRKYKRKAN